MIKFDEHECLGSCGKVGYAYNPDKLPIPREDLICVECKNKGVK